MPMRDYKELKNLKIPAEQWAREHVEKGAEEESRNVLELMVALTDKVDRLAEKIKVAEKMIEESRCVTDATFGEVDERFAEVKALLREKEEWAAEQEQQEPERERQEPEHPEESSDLHAIIDALENRIDNLDEKMSNEALIFREVSKRNQGARFLHGVLQR